MKLRRYHHKVIQSQSSVLYMQVSNSLFMIVCM